MRQFSVPAPPGQVARQICQPRYMPPARIAGMPQLPEMAMIPPPGESERCRAALEAIAPDREVRNAAVGMQLIRMAIDPPETPDAMWDSLEPSTWPEFRLEAGRDPEVSKWATTWDSLDPSTWPSMRFDGSG